MIVLSQPAITKSNLELVTLAELKTFMNTTGQDDDDTRAAQVVDAVNRRAFDYMRQRFVKSTGTSFDVIVDGPFTSSELILPYRPIVSLTLVEEGYYDTNGWNATYTYQSSEYIRDDENGILYAVASSGFPAGRACLRLTLEQGYATIPPDLKHALLQVMAIELSRARGQRLDMTAETNEAGSTTYTFTTFPASTLQVLRRYTYNERAL